MHRPLASLFLRLTRGAGSMNEQSGSIVFTEADSDDQLSLVDILDHVLNQGVVCAETWSSHWRELIWFTSAWT